MAMPYNLSTAGQLLKPTQNVDPVMGREDSNHIKHWNKSSITMSNSVKNWTHIDTHKFSNNMNSVNYDMVSLISYTESSKKEIEGVQHQGILEAHLQRNQFFWKQITGNMAKVQ